jgi:hypothetical protein
MTARGLPLKERFELYVSPEPNTGCHLWMGFCEDSGFGRFATKSRTTAHRAAYEIYRGPIPEGVQVFHKCDVNCCVNPDHLFLRTDRKAGSLAGSKRYGSVMDRIERDTHYEPNSGCWLYAGPIDDSGYGRVRVERKKVRVHHFTFQKDNGPLAKGKVVMHSCDMPCCWNPDHLSIGTHRDNTQDSVKKDRWPVGERNVGAKLTNEDIAAIRASFETHRALGSEYGVAHSTIGNIKRRKKWRHRP